MLGQTNLTFEAHVAQEELFEFGVGHNFGCDCATEIFAEEIKDLEAWGERCECLQHLL